MSSSTEKKNYKTRPMAERGREGKEGLSPTRAKKKGGGI